MLHPEVFGSLRMLRMRAIIGAELPLLLREPEISRRAHA
jgi:hypothetical protein